MISHNNACHLSNPHVTIRLKHSTLHRKNRAGNPQTMVYMNLQPLDDTARRSPGAWWSLTPPSHPYHNIYGGCFLLSYPTVANSFHFQKQGTLCCPDFPLIPKRYQRQAGALLSLCKSTLKRRYDKKNSYIFIADI